MLTENVQSDYNELNAIEYEPDADDFEGWNIEPERNINFPVLESLTDSQNMKMTTLMQNYKNIFASSINDLVEPCKIGSFEIKLSETTPIRLYPYRKAYVAFYSGFDK